MALSLKKLLSPKSIAVVGGGAWCAAVIEQAEKFGFTGDIFPVHPSGKTIAGRSTYPTLLDAPNAPDATFIGINRDATIDVVERLRKMDAGGAVCFASGFAEAQAEDDTSASRQDRLLAAAGDMPILGPNCYGFINALDGALLWPDQHGCQRVDSGVAILTQSSNIAINLSMQKRGLPIAYLVTCGNMAQTSQADIALSLLDDPRVTAIGLHIEGFGDLRKWEKLAAHAYEKNIPLVAIKVGKSDQAQLATVSHTASMAGNDIGASAVLKRLNIARVFDLPTLLETLKIFHIAGPLKSNRIASISCSGGEASLAADTAHDMGLEFPDLTDVQKTNLRDALGPKVALANPLDYHTYIWRDTDAMTKAWSAMADDNLALTMTIVDYPRADTCDDADWICATQAALNTAKNTDCVVAVTTTLPELLPEHISKELMAGGVVPLHGLTEALAAIDAAVQQPWTKPEPLCLDDVPLHTETIDEFTAKQRLKQFGLEVPKAIVASSPTEAGSKSSELQFPVVAKGMGLAHKTEHNAVALNLTSPEDVIAAATTIPSDHYLIEEMITDGIAELLIGVTRDPAHGFVLTIGAGGTLTEILKDSVSLLIPSSETDIKQALTKLKMWKILTGYRGKPAVNIEAVIQSVIAIQSYVVAHTGHLTELEINPLICTPTKAVAADALIQEGEKP